MRKQLGLLAGSLLALVMTASTAQAGVSKAQAAKLGKSLTPFGAQVEGNGKDVSTGFGIPDWTGGLTSEDIPASYTQAGQYHPSPFPDDKVLFTINAQNKAKYAEKLTIGTKALMETYPDTFFMDVYRSRRTTSAPQWVYDNTKKNAVTAELVDGGNGVVNAFGGTPFPILHGSSEQKALQAIWNHIMRWRGVFVVLTGAQIPVQANGDFVPVINRQEVYFKYYDPEYSADELDNTMFYYLTVVKAPPRLAGGVVLVRETLNQTKEPRQAWGYNPGLRRVRRAPNIAYDMPVPEADGIITAEEIDMYNGSPHKYNWKLVYDHPVEKFIPYNNYRLNTNELSYDEVIQPGHIKSDLVRWELHRVWVIEGTLKPSERHIYKKRIFYIDADSWQLVESDVYDSRGELWRVGLAMMMNFYEVPTQWSVIDVHHDLRSKRYYVVHLPVKGEGDRDFTQPVPNRRYFSPAALMRRGR